MPSLRLLCLVVALACCQSAFAQPPSLSWGSLTQDGSCSRCAFRQYYAKLNGIPSGQPWENYCPGRQSFGISGLTSIRKAVRRQTDLRSFVHAQALPPLRRRSTAIFSWVQPGARLVGLEFTAGLKCPIQAATATGAAVPVTPSRTMAARTAASTSTKQRCEWENLLDFCATARELLTPEAVMAQNGNQLILKHQLYSVWLCFKFCRLGLMLADMKVYGQAAQTAWALC